MREAKSFCRTCIAGCGVVLTIDEEGRIAAADAALRTGVVSMSHNWGDLSNNDPQQYRRHGASTNFLIHDAAVYESINAMPRMSAIPVNVAPWTGPGSPSLV